MTRVEKWISLKDYTTLRLGGKAAYFTRISNSADLAEAVEYAQAHNVPVFPLGGGSNLIVRDEVPDMLIIKIENKGIEIIKESKEHKYIDVRVAAGEVWDEFVTWSVEQRLSGIEALSMIPGTCGATPVQNVGAYDQEVSQVIQSVRVFDLETKRLKDILTEDCQFSYRDSIFKNKLKSKCIIESVVFRLSKSEPAIPDYPLVSETLGKIKLENPDDSLNLLIRKAIQHIRSSKLPDPKIIASAGSFFKNPIITADHFEKVRSILPDVKFFKIENQEDTQKKILYKIPAGWLIEKAGYKGTLSQSGNVGVYGKNALVLVNYSAEHTEELLDLAKEIQDTVYSMCGISLEIEPEIM
jgi:UDP-N-acetylmuramate dehydrogenase